MAKEKRYAIIEVKENDCIFRQFDTFEGDYFCNHDKIWLDSKADCKGCKYKDNGETKKQYIAKAKTALQRKILTRPLSIDDEAKAVINYLGMK